MKSAELELNLFIYMWLFNYAFSNSDCVVLNVWMMADNKLEMIWKKHSWCRIKVNSWNLPGRSAEDHEVSVPAKIQIGHLSDASPDHY